MASLFFDDCYVGQPLDCLSKGPMRTAHIMRWSAAIENWHRIHYDQPFAVQYDGLPNVVINGSWKQHVLVQLTTDWAGETGWLWRIRFQFRGLNIEGETLTAWGKVARKQDCGRYGLVFADIGLTNERGEDGTPGQAMLVFPKAGGPPVSYPFDPASLDLKGSVRWDVP